MMVQLVHYYHTICFSLGIFVGSEVLAIYFKLNVDKYQLSIQFK